MDFDEYVGRYCNTYRTSLETAECHAIVKEVKKYYAEEKEAKKGIRKPIEKHEYFEVSVCPRAAYQ